MKQVRQAIVLVDNHRPANKRRNTYGRYRVGAKTEKEAVELVRQAIGFGSIQFYYWEKDNNPDKIKAKYKEVINDSTELPARHACNSL